MKTAIICTVFLPSGYCWEIENRRIRTRNPSGRIHMGFRRFVGPWQLWLRTARSLTYPQSVTP